MVFSRPMRSDTQPKNGRVRPLVMRSIDSAKGSAGRPKTRESARPQSREKAPNWEMTIRPELAIIVIMTNISQKIGVRSISAGGEAAGAFLHRRVGGRRLALHRRLPGRIRTLQAECRGEPDRAEDDAPLQQRMLVA